MLRFMGTRGPSRWEGGEGAARHLPLPCGASQRSLEARTQGRVERLRSIDLLNPSTPVDRVDSTRFNPSTLTLGKPIATNRRNEEPAAKERVDGTAGGPFVLTEFPTNPPHLLNRPDQRFLRFSLAIA